MAKPSLSQNPSGAYVYEIVVDGVVRYIGKGRGPRAWTHTKAAESLLRKRKRGVKVRASLFYNRLAKALQKGATCAVVVVSDGMNDEEAFAAEMASIAALPHGQLWNILPGGSGGDRSFFQRFWEKPGTREHQSRKQKQVWDTPGYRDRQQEVQKVSCGTDEFRRRRSVEMRSRFEREEYRAAHAEMIMRRWQRDRTQLLEQIQAGKEKAREKFSASVKKLWEDPEYRARLCAAQKARWTPEARQQRSEKMKAKYAAERERKEKAV